MMFSEHLKQLPSVAHLSHASLFNPQGKCVGFIENKPGQAGSLAVYHYLAQAFGSISPDAAKRGLELYAEHSTEAQQNPGKHPNIDRLFKIIHSSETLTLTPHVTTDFYEA
jgi:hypothetical protein